MNTKDLEKFDPTVAELNAMIQITKNITATDLKDKGQMAVVRENRIALKTARVRITKIGKELREDAVNFQKAVLVKEKELIGIIEPEEIRLADIEAQAISQAILEERLEKLPSRKERLSLVKIYPTDEILLDMDSTQFENYYNEKVADYNENVRIETENAQREAQEKIDVERKVEQEKIEAQQKQVQDQLDAERKAIDDERAIIDAEKNNIARQKEIEDAKDKARADEKIRLELEIKQKKEQEDNQARLVVAEKKLEEQKLEKRKAFIDFRTSHGWTEKTKDDFKIEETLDGFILYKKMGVFNK